MQRIDELPAVSDETLQGTAQALLGKASIEVTPGDLQGIDAARAFLGRGSRVYIANVGRHSYEETFATAKRLCDNGFVPVPHIAARRLESQAELERLVRGLAPMTDEALLIAGDLHKTVGPFGSTLDVMRTGVLEKEGLRRVGLAGYPEGHRLIDDALLEDALLDKIDHARHVGLEPYIVSQFCFDPGAISAWEQRIRRLTGGTVDMHIGIPGVTALGKLLRFATLCGTGASIRFLRQHAYQVAQLMKAWLPDALVLDICRIVLADPACRITQFHLFPFGGIEASLRWLKAAQNGLLDVAEARG